MIVRVNGKPHRDLHARRRAVSWPTWPARATRIPSGHPEAFLEAFANIYTAAFDDMVEASRRAEVRLVEEPLSQRRRRRGRHELHHAVRGQLEGERRVAVAEA